jgi:hypothetical protein
MSVRSKVIEPSLAQRAIQSALATREISVVVLVLACVVVEFGVLAATQRYEALTAPPGTVLFFGMSAGGMVMFFAELLKLPIAWTSGVVTGGKRIVFNLVTALLCVLTALTIKDLTLREWDQALQPSTLKRVEAQTLEREIGELTSDLERLLSFTETTRQDFLQQIERLNDEVKLADSQRARELEAYERRLSDLRSEAVDPQTQARIKVLRDETAQRQGSLERRRATMLDEIEQLRNADGVARAESTRRYDAEVESVKAERAKRESEYRDAEKRASEQYALELKQYNDALAAYNAAQSEYEARVAERQKALDAEIKEIESKRGPLGGILDGTGDRVREAQARAKSDTDRFLEDFNRRPKPVTPVKALVPAPALPPLPLPPSGSAEAGNQPRIQQAIDQLRALEQETRDADASTESQIRTLIDEAAAASQAAGAADAKRLDALKLDHDKSMKVLAERIAGLNERKTELEAELRNIQRSPDEIEADRARLLETRREKEAARDAARADATRLWQDTNAVRAATGFMGWIMRDSSEEEKLGAARALFPMIIGLFVASLPALVLEVGIHSLLTPVAERRRSQWNLIRRFSIARRALALERGKTASARLNAERLLAEATQARTEAETQAAARHAEVDAMLARGNDLLAQREASADAEIAAKRMALESEIERAVAARTEALQSQAKSLEEEAARHIETIRKQRSDIEQLASRVIELDARSN